MSTKEPPLSSKLTTCMSGIPVHTKRKAVIFSSYQEPRLLGGVGMPHIYHRHSTAQLDRMTMTSRAAITVCIWLLISLAIVCMLSTKMPSLQAKCSDIFFHVSTVTTGLVSSFYLWVKGWGHMSSSCLTEPKDRNSSFRDTSIILTQ